MCIWPHLGVSTFHTMGKLSTPYNLDEGEAQEMGYHPGHPETRSPCGVSWGRAHVKHLLVEPWFLGLGLAKPDWATDSWGWSDWKARTRPQACWSLASHTVGASSTTSQLVCQQLNMVGLTFIHSMGSQTQHPIKKIIAFTFQNIQQKLKSLKQIPKND